MAVSLVLVLPPSVAGASCTTVENFRVGEIKACDSDHDGAADTLTADTGPFFVLNQRIPGGADAKISVVDEHKASPHGDRAETKSEVLISLAVPLHPAVHSEAKANDHDADGNTDHVSHTGAVFVRSPVGQSVQHFVGFWDLNDDGQLETVGFVVCTTGVGCQAPGLDSIPGPPDVPEPVFYIDGVGWVP